MTDTVSFQSPGLIDPRCITTMGVSVKEGENPIGQFGTGLKYAIAIILRNGGDISIWRGLEELKFTAQPVEIRGKAVQVVTMNGQELGFTTHLGAHWKMWQAFRELYCNTVDEGGEHAAGAYPLLDGVTTVIVKLEAFAACLRELGQHVLLTKPIYDGDRAAFHPGPSRSIFYRGIKVAEWPNEKPHKFAVNIKHEVALTEDRTLRESYEVVSAVAHTVVTSKDAGFIERFIGAGVGFAEHTADLKWGNEPSVEFMRVTCDRATRGEEVNRSALNIYKDYSPAPKPIAAQLLPHERQALAAAIAFCRALGYPVDEYPIVVVDTLGPNILGEATTDPKEILIALAAFKAGDQTLAGTLLEEWVHLKHGHNDGTRSMQNWLVDALIHMGKAYLHAKGSA